MTDGPRLITVDINVNDWKLTQAAEYRRVTGVNAQYALRVVQLAWNQAMDEMRAEFGEEMLGEGWQAPEGYVPLALLNVDDSYLMGFAWVAHKREEPDAVFEAWLDDLPVGELNAAFYAAMTELVEEAAGPLANRAQRRANGRRSKTASGSATSCAGVSTTSIDSASESSTT